MTPVINPWVFYLMPVCENVSDFAWIICIISGIVLAMLCIGYIVAMTDDFYEMQEVMMKAIKKVLPLFVIVSLLACFIPSEETITKMIVAQNVTVERVDAVSDTVVTVYNDIMNLFRDSGAVNG